MLFNRGGWLRSDPCVPTQVDANDRAPLDIPVGPTADDFATALKDHPLLDTTTPIDITLAGYSGKSMDLQVPTDIADCPNSYKPWDGTIYAQGPGTDGTSGSSMSMASASSSRARTMPEPRRRIEPNCRRSWTRS